jgi:hypothetical protein
VPVPARTDPTAEPAEVTPRYRCTACGNLTRFDVTATRRTRAFHHYSVGGDLRVEELEVLGETVEAVECRWCGNGSAVVPLDDAGEV